MCAAMRKVCRPFVRMHCAHTNEKIEQKKKLESDRRRMKKRERDRAAIDFGFVKADICQRKYKAGVVGTVVIDTALLLLSQCHV